MKSRVQKGTSIKVFLSVIFIILLQMDLRMDIPPGESFYSKDRIFEIFMLIIFYHSFKPWESGKSHYKKYSIVTASILAGFYVLGYNIARYQDLFSKYNHNWMLGKLFLKWLVFWYCFSTGLLFIYTKLDNFKFHGISKRIKNLPSVIRQLGLMLVFAVCWSPALIRNFPGVIYVDSWRQIYEALGIEELTMHHPIIHTLFVRLCLTLCNNIEQGIAIYTLISFFIIITVLSYTVNLMLEDFDKRIIVMAILIYVAFPSVPMFTITITKDSWFATFVGLFSIELYILVIRGKTQGKYWVGLTVASLGVSLFRKNGMYLLFFTAIYILIYTLIKKAGYKNILFVLVFAICFNLSVEWTAGSLFDVEQGLPREALSLPIQQMARIKKNVQDLDVETKQRIDAFFEEGCDLGGAYYPLISDNAKNLFDDESFKNRKTDFFALSVHLLLRYPEESLEAFMCNSFGYWYPITNGWCYPENNDNYLDIEQTVSRHEYPDNVTYVSLNEYKNIAVLDLLSSIGIIFWLFIAISGYLIANKKFEKWFLMMPMCGLWCTSVASPVWNELRYVLAIYLALPIICQLTVKNRVNTEEKK